MGVINKVELGNVDFFGEMAIAFREVYNNGDWKFVLETDNERIVMMTY